MAQPETPLCFDRMWRFLSVQDMLFHSNSPRRGVPSSPSSPSAKASASAIHTGGGMDCRAQLRESLQTQCSYDDTFATMQNAALRCSVPCQPGEQLKMRVRYNRGEKLSVGCILSPSSSSAGASTAATNTDANGQQQRGNSTYCYTGKLPPGWCGVGWDSRAVESSLASGASIRCDGMSSLETAPASHSLSNPQHSTNSFCALAPNDEGKLTAPEKSSGRSDTCTGLPSSASPPFLMSSSPPRIVFAPGQTLSIVIDRRQKDKEVFAIGIDKPYSAPTPIFRLPSSYGGAPHDGSKCTSSKAMAHVVLLHYGNGEAELELVSCSTTSDANGETATQTAAKPTMRNKAMKTVGDRAALLWARGAGTELVNQTSTNSSGISSTGSPTSVDSSTCSTSANLFDSKVYLAQRSDESTAELERLAAVALDSL